MVSLCVRPWIKFTQEYPFKTTAESERCFSTLKRIKTFLRNAMAQNCLYALAMFSMKKNLIQTFLTLTPKSLRGLLLRKTKEALSSLQRTWVRLPAWVPLPRVTPPLLPSFLSHSSAILSIKPEKGQKNMKLLLPLRVSFGHEGLHGQFSKSTYHAMVRLSK